jgi:hypothetical protein
MPRFLILLQIVLLTCLTAQVPSRAVQAVQTPGGMVHVKVTSAETGRPLPCRLTIVDDKGNLAVVQAEKRAEIAVRPGVVYTATGEARFSAPRGRYTLYATRGPEYGLATRLLDVGEREAAVTLKLAHEVSMTGYVSCDTHIHTFTYSRHGDSTIEERMVTLAGEGIELPIATDHNLHIDYTPVMRATGTQAYFTPVIGNEITTGVGHLNAFPVRAGSSPAAYNLKNREQILAGIRATPGVQVVILNHPNDVHSGFTPAAPALFHAASGESLDGSPWSVDGIEVINSGATQSDFMAPYRVWFALLNRGHKIVGVGASDSHDVNRFIVGQGRTYIASSATQPDKIDVDEACRNLKAGRALVSTGLFTEMWVDGRFGVGDTATGLGKDVKVRVRVRGPSWATADRVELFANGQKIAGQPIIHAQGAVTKADVTFTLKNPGHDLWLVAIASGPGVTEPYWPIARPYQPTRADWEPRVIGSTSPIRLDCDGDRRYSSPLDYARSVFEANGSSPERLIRALQPYDEAVAVQAASLCRSRGMDMSINPFRDLIENAAPAVRQGFVAYQRLLPAAK